MTHLIQFWYIFFIFDTSKITRFPELSKRFSYKRYDKFLIPDLKIN